MEINEVSKTAKSSFGSFLSNKPLWAFWIAYTLLCAMLFGIFYGVIYLMAQLWWVPVIAIIVIGMIWGTLAYTPEKILPEKNETMTNNV